MQYALFQFVSFLSKAVDTSQIQTTSIMTAEDIPKHQFVCLVVQPRTMLIFNVAKPKSPMEFTFQSRYGSIVGYEWFMEDMTLIIGFSKGFVTVTSTGRSTHLLVCVYVLR